MRFIQGPWDSTIRIYIWRGVPFPRTGWYIWVVPLSSQEVTCLREIREANLRWSVAATSPSGVKWGSLVSSISITTLWSQLDVFGEVVSIGIGSCMTHWFPHEVSTHTVLSLWGAQCRFSWTLRIMSAKNWVFWCYTRL